MNNYPYLIKAKAKANEAKSLFCWFSAKSDSRAERKILDILEDAEINVGRGAGHQLPIRTNWLIVDDLPEEGVLDDTWCDRYELGGEDGLTWQKSLRRRLLNHSPPVNQKTISLLQIAMKRTIRTMKKHSSTWQKCHSARSCLPSIWPTNVTYITLAFLIETAFQRWKWIRIITVCRICC